MIKIEFESADTVKFSGSTLSEIRAEIKRRRAGGKVSVSALIPELEKRYTQKALAEKLGVSARFLRYVKTGKRLTVEPKHGKGKKSKIHGVRAGLINLARKENIALTGGFTAGQIRPYVLLDFICLKDGEIQKDIHEEFYAHSAGFLNEVFGKNYYAYATEDMREAIRSMCSDGDYCDTVLYYSRANQSPKNYNTDKARRCSKKVVAKWLRKNSGEDKEYIKEVLDTLTDDDFCHSKLISNGNKRLLYSVLMKH